MILLSMTIPGSKGQSANRALFDADTGILYLESAQGVCVIATPHERANGSALVTGTPYNEIAAILMEAAADETEGEE